ncbi:MAG: M14 family zinc carboxypeptidase, partial [Acidobacteriota bacterium]
VLGFEVGAQAARHDQLVAYFRELAESSDRVRLESIGRTHENREQVMAVISSPDNLARLDDIRERHRAVAAGEAEPDDGPAIVWQGYSIHGDENSGANASMLYAYHLAAARDADTRRSLDEVVVLVDPALNPDGLARYAAWATERMSKNPVTDPAHREHHQAWPGGRTNHYWFDLNRDWLLLQHPESRNRVRLFQLYRPNVLADFHEMGTSRTYFFQPGVPSRQNPLTPPENVELTQEIARYHARALDELGSLYYTQETFDDFYYGKGSTYPDVQGAVGILFEQSSTRGHVQEKGPGQGTQSFPFAIRNQFVTSLSTLRGAVAKREDLLAYQARFYRDALAEAAGDPVRAHVVADAGDPARLHEMVRVLRGHGIEVHRLAERLEQSGDVYEPGRAVVVPTEQRQYRLVRALFERRTEFQDTTFYDVSAWTLPLAFGLPSAELERGSFRQDLVGPPVDGETFPEGRFREAAGDEAGPAEGAAGPVAYAFEWTGFYAPRALGRLLQEEILVRIATRPFEARVGSLDADERHAFGYGTVVVPLGIQPDRAGAIRELLATAAREDGIEIHALPTGLTGDGVDLGSPSLDPLELPEPLVVIGDGVSSYAAGEVWHHLDHRLRLPVTLVDRSYLESVDLARYSHVILPHGGWDGLPEGVVESLGEWVRDEGGTLVALQGAAVWAEGALLGQGDQTGEPGPSNGGAGPDAEATEARPYATFRDDAAVPLVSGTIFEAQVDTTHPLAYGYTRDLLPVFRTTTDTLTPSGNVYDTPVRYTEDPLLAGYVSDENLERLGGTPAVIATRLGGGVVVRMVDDPVFRAYWLGTSRLLANAVFYGSLVDRTEVPEGVQPPGR